jgi:hypothetical protein
MSDSLLAKIKLRVLELMITKDVSRAEATRQAAKEYGRTIKDTTAKPRKSTTHHASSSNIKEELFARINSIRQRLFPDAAPEDDMTAALAERGCKPHTTGGMFKRAIERIRFQETDEPVAPNMPKPTEQPVPAEYSSTYSEVYVGKGHREMIPDSEFPIGLVSDIATRNYQEQQRTQSYKAQTPQNEIDPINDPAAVEAALQRQQAQNIIPFRVSK